MKRKVKKKPFIIIFIILIILGAGAYGVKYAIDTINYHKTYEYKFITLGYSLEDTKVLDKLSDLNKDYLLESEYDKEIISLINEKYFIEKNLKEYIEFKNTNDYSLSDVVALINTHAFHEWYEVTFDSDVSKGNLLIANKFYKLGPSYNSDNMVKVSIQYCYGNNQMLTEEAYNAYIDMFKSAKKEGLTLIINSSYRSYEAQKDIYNEYRDMKGEEYADSIAAKAGHSEHQTGLAVDIQTYGSTGATFENFDEFKWLQENAHKYGFILRYPKDKEYITGYAYESWHYRYVGVEAATYIKENNITFDEYYAYFVER